MSELINRQQLANGAAERWKKQYYYPNGGWQPEGWRAGLDKQKIYEELLKLGPNPNPDEVDRTIGNTSWTSLQCDECKTPSELVIRVGAPMDYESHTADLSCRHSPVKANRTKILIYTGALPLNKAVGFPVSGAKSIFITPGTVHNFDVKFGNHAGTSR